MNCLAVSASYRPTPVLDGCGDGVRDGCSCRMPHRILPHSGELPGAALPTLLRRTQGHLVMTGEPSPLAACFAGGKAVPSETSL